MKRTTAIVMLCIVGMYGLLSGSTAEASAPIHATCWGRCEGLVWSGPMRNSGSWQAVSCDAAVSMCFAELQTQCLQQRQGQGFTAQGSRC